MRRRLGRKPSAIKLCSTPTCAKVIDEGVAARQRTILDEESKMGREVNGRVIALDVGRHGTKSAGQCAMTGRYRIERTGGDHRPG
jgi:hypothetical protein